MNQQAPNSVIKAVEAVFVYNSWLGRDKREKDRKKEKREGGTIHTLCQESRRGGVQT